VGTIRGAFGIGSGFRRRLVYSMFEHVFSMRPSRKQESSAGRIVDSVGTHLELMLFVFRTAALDLVSRSLLLG